MAPLTLRVEKDGAQFTTLALEPGAHVLGRSPECRVVLPGKDVSSRHARLDVGEGEVWLTDLESLNGVYSGGHKTGKVRFTGNVEFELAGYRFQGVFKPKRTRPRLVALPRPGLKPLTLGVVALCALATAALVHIPFASQVRQQSAEGAMRFGSYLVRSLAQQNAQPLRQGKLDDLRVTPAALEEGVRYAQIADAQGKILAPPQSMGKPLDSSRVDKTLKEGATTFFPGPSGETVMMTPIKDQGQTLGLAVVGFDTAGAVASSMPPGVLLAMLVSLVLALAAGVFLLRAFASPLRRLAEEIGVAAKSRARSLNFTPPTPEMDELARAVERVLILAPGASTREGAADGGPDAWRAGEARRTDVPAAGSTGETPEAGGMAPAEEVGASASDGAVASDAPPAPGPVPATPPGAPGPSEAWCLADLTGYQLTAWSPPFAALLAAPQGQPPVHLLQAFADPAALSAVLGLMEPGAAAQSAPLEGSSRRVTRRLAGEGLAYFVFTESGDG
jgi:hypothetical protein